MNEQQRDEVIEQFCEIIVDGMDIKTLCQYVYDDLEHFYSNRCTWDEFKEFVDDHDPELFDELVDNVLQQFPRPRLKFDL
tara:strand:- start:5907 stop:6146 length:240 start_codon:yes stop_codon:yes gene_type:complete